MPLLTREIAQLRSMQKYPSSLYFEGRDALLDVPKVSLVGTRKPSQYTRTLTHRLASTLAKAGIAVVSGGAMGVDAIAHAGATPKNTIAVLPCGIDLKYPAVNKTLLGAIEKEGLLLSQFERGFKATPWSFVVRNELVVALGDVLIVAEAELESGSMRSVAYALEMQKEIFVLPHRIGESGGTNALLQEHKAEAIYDIDRFVQMLLARYGLGASKEEKREYSDDPFLAFCKTTPTYEEAMRLFASRVFEAELGGEILVKEGRVFLA